MVPMPSRVFALIRKDARIHGRAIAVTQCALLGVAAVAVTMRPDAGSVNTTLVLNFNILFSGFWSEWLVSREKTKGTFAWLRASAITDTELVVAKFLAVGLCTTTLWIASALLFIRPAAGEAVTIWAGLLAFAALTVASRWRFDAKLGQFLPYALLLVPLLILIGLGRIFDIRLDPAGMIAPAWHLAATVLLLLIGAALVMGTQAWVARTDTYRFLE